MNQQDMANQMATELSINSTGASASVNGASLDCRDCGPEVHVVFIVGPNNPGNDTTIAWKLQSSPDDSTWTDWSGATGTSVSGDSTNDELLTFFNRNARYVRAVATLTGTSPTPDLHAFLAARKVSY